MDLLEKNKSASPEVKASCRVAHITTSHPAMDARIFYREAAGLKELGFDVCVVGPHPKREVVDGIEILPVSRPGNVFLRMAMTPCRGLRAVMRSKASLVHFHDPELLPVALLTKWFSRKKVVFDAHEDISLLGLKDWVPGWLKKPLMATMTAVDKFCASRVDAVVTPTRLLEDRYRAIAPRAMTFVNYPAPSFLAERDHVWTPQDQRRNEVVHLGTLRIVRMEFLLKVAEQFLQAHPDWTWTLLGMHEQTMKWFEQRVPAHLRGRLVGVGKIPHMEVGQRLCQAKIGINYHPLDSRQVQVAIPLKVFEYMASGLPVVTTRVPLLVELVQDCPAVHLCDDSVESYLAALESLTDEPRRQSLGALARQFSDERFNCSAEARKLGALYSDIFSGRGGA